MSSLPPNHNCLDALDMPKWDNKVHEWHDKLFIKDSVRQIFHIPINIGSVISRMSDKVEAARAMVPDKEFLILAYDPSPWKSELYMTVSKEVPGAEMAKLSGTFVSKIFDGPYNAIPKWIPEIDSLVKQKGFDKVIRYYFHYAMCPGCAKKHGHNYVVAFALVKEA